MSRSPVRQNGRCGHSGGAPTVSWFAAAASDVIVVSPNRWAVSAFATNTFVSCAGDGVSTEIPPGSRSARSCAAAASGSLECSAFASRKNRSDDRYSGLRSICPDSNAVCETSRASRSNCRSTV